MNENEMARTVCEREGGRYNLNIGEVKEVMRNTLDILTDMEDSDIKLFIKHHIKIKKDRLRKQAKKKVA